MVSFVRRSYLKQDFCGVIGKHHRDHSYEDVHMLIVITYNPSSSVLFLLTDYRRDYFPKERKKTHQGYELDMAGGNKPYNTFTVIKPPI